MNKVNIQAGDYGYGVALNHVRLDGVQSVAYRRDQTGRPIVTIELIAELYQTDDEDLYRERRAATARSEAEVAALKSKLAAVEQAWREGRNKTVYGGFNVSLEDGPAPDALRAMYAYAAELGNASAAVASAPASNQSTPTAEEE